MHTLPKNIIMQQEEYITGRVDQDFNWYDKKASLYRNLHIYSRIMVIFISASITVLTVVEFQYKNVLIAILSSFIVIITGVTELMKFKEQWFEYRTTAEIIKSEKLFFLTNTEPYNAADNFNLFVKNYELIVKGENKNWKNYISAKS